MLAVADQHERTDGKGGESLSVSVRLIPLAFVPLQIGVKIFLTHLRVGNRRLLVLPIPQHDV